VVWPILFRTHGPYALLGRTGGLIRTLDPQAGWRQRGSSGEVPCRDAVVDNEPFEGVHTRGITDLLDRLAQRP
jgi:hypothetical protein